MTPQTFQLVMRAGPNPGKVFALDRSDISIGRGANNTFVINDAEISRNHARLTKSEAGYLIEDLGSTNGTFINGQKISGQQTLKSGDSLQLGENVVLSYEVVGEGEEATVVAGAERPAPEPTPTPTPRQAPPAQPKPAPVAQPAPQQPVYAGQVPPGPSDASAEKKSISPWIWAGCGCLIVAVIIVVIVGLVYIDAGGAERWCQYFGWALSNCP
jgi:predicted component of type VI protein secretion system